MTRASLNTEDLRSLVGDGGFGEAIVIVAPKRVWSALDIEHESGERMESITLDSSPAGDELPGELDRLGLFGAPMTVFLVSEHDVTFLDSPALHRARVAAVPFFSTPFAPSELQTVIELECATHHASALEREAQMLERLEAAKTMRFIDGDVEATFDYRGCRHWFSLTGPLAEGNQTVLPTGELSVLTHASGDLDDLTAFELDGRIRLAGAAIVHRGSETIARERVDDIWSRLGAIRTHGVVVEVESGFIHAVEEPGRGESSAAGSLRALLDSDHRYRRIHEVGFGLNANCSPLRNGNYLTNERFPGVHFGIGLGGHTDFHIDFVCRDTRILLDSDGPERIDLFES